MSNVARYAKAIAKTGEGDRLAELMLEVAETTRQAPGCELYIVNRVPGEPDTIWITELWASQEDLDGALDVARASDDGLMGRVLEVVEAFERVDLEPVGGVGLQPRPAAGWTHVSVGGVTDHAPKFGLQDSQEMRMVTGPLGLERTGLSVQRVHAGQRHAFGHSHVNAEETYVILSGAGTLAVGSDEIAVTEGDAVRVGPTLTRAFEGGPDGIEFLAVGPRCPGDGAMHDGWWGD